MAIVLEARGWQRLTDWVLVMPCLGAMLSPLCVGALADQRVNAERVAASVLILGAFSMAGACWFLGAGDSPLGFILFLILKSLVGPPAWSLVMSITLTHLPNPEREFGAVRVWGTIGWMMACWMISLLSLDLSPMSWMLGAVLSLAAGLFCLTLPSTPPQGEGSQSLSEMFGLKAFGILKNRATGVYFLTAFLFSIPLAAYYPYSAKYLKFLGVQNVATFLSVGQLSELAAMLLMGFFFRRFGVKWTLLFALGSGVLRYLCYAFTTWQGSPEGGVLLWMVAGVLMHGACWTFFFEGGRLIVDREVATSMRNQAQALLTVMIGGVATILGVCTCGALYRWCVESDGPGWGGFWSILFGLTIVATVVFCVGFKGGGKEALERPC